MASADSADGDIIERLRKRDPAGLTAAYDRYGRSIYSLFVRITKDRAASEDLCQELFVKLWNKAMQFQGERGALSVWLFAVARNMAIDHIRSSEARFQHRVSPIENVERLPKPSRPNTTESRKDLIGAVRDAFVALKPNEKQVMELAYFEGLTQSEIAAKLNQPLGTVKSWMRSATGRLRDALGVKSTT